MERFAATNSVWSRRMVFEHYGGESTKFGKHRAEALSDAVFPIAMTVLVLNLKVPSVMASGQLWLMLKQDAALWSSVVLTFAITSLFWMLQHRVFDVLETMSAQTMRLTILTLGFVTVLPFTTSLLGQSKGDPLAFELYFGNMSAIALTMALKLEWAGRQGDLRTGPATDRTRQRVWRISVIMLATAVSARFAPLQRIWVLPVVVSLGMRVVWSWVARRNARAHVQTDTQEAG